MIEPTLNGLLLSLSLIVAIGAQNAFVLRQGLMGRHVFWLCMFCGFSDAVLIGLGVMTFSTVTEFWTDLPRYLAWAGAAFLAVYGANRFRAAWNGSYQFLAGEDTQSLLATLATAALLTFANPHVYLDTFGLIGAISANYTGASRMEFALGAISGSFLFFFSLGYGARILAPLFASKTAWKVLDLIIGVVMWQIAVMLILRFT